jgi:hypothetical protein
VDVTVQDRPQDKIHLALAHSDELLLWEEILDRAMDNKTFVKFLDRQKDQSLDGMIAAAKQLKFVTQTTGDFSFDDNNNYSFIFKVGDAEGTAKFPSEMDVLFSPVLENGLLSQTVSFEIELKKPTNEREKPLIIVMAPRLADVIKEAIQKEVEDIKLQLPGYLILNGSVTGK